MPTSWMPEMYVDKAWTPNGLRFATEAEANGYATNLFLRWTQPTDKRATPSEDPVNSTWSAETGKVAPTIANAAPTPA